MNTPSVGRYAQANDVTVRLLEQNDRLGAVGGELELASAPGRDTTIGGRVPVGTER